MVKVKYRNINKYRETKNMSLSIEELEEFEKALETIRAYESKTNMKIIKAKRFKQVTGIIANSKKQKEDMALGERLERLENTVSKLVNVNVQTKTERK